MINAATLALALAGLASEATPLTSFALTDAEWWAMCPRILTDAQAKKRGLSFTPLVQTAPKYPTRGEDLEAAVVLDVRVATDGKVVDARVATAAPAPADDDRFIEPTLTAVRSWRYAPPIVDGKPSCLAISVTVQYVLAP